MAEERAARDLVESLEGDIKAAREGLKVAAENRRRHEAVFEQVLDAADGGQERIEGVGLHGEGD